MTTRTEVSKKGLGYTFLPMPLAVNKIDLTLTLTSTGSSPTASRQMKLDEVMVYSYMQQRMSFFKSIGGSYYDSYADIANATRVLVRTVEKIVPRLRDMGIINYSHVWLEDRKKSKNVYSYIISPMDFVQKYHGATIDLTGDEAVVIYRTGTSKPPKPNDIPDLMLNDAVYCRAKGISKKVKVEGSSLDVVEEQPMVRNEKPDIEAPELMQEPVDPPINAVNDEREIKKLILEYRRIGFNLAWDDESNAYIVWQGDQAIEILSDIDEAESCLLACKESYDKKRAGEDW